MDHKDLDVWKYGMNCVDQVYKLTCSFPDEEKFGLVNQMRRCAVSIPSNIAEGSARQGNKEFAHFISIAIGSLAELETQYLIAIRLGYIENNSDFNKLLIDLKKLLLGFRNHLKRTTNH